MESLLDAIKDPLIGDMWSYDKPAVEGVYVAVRGDAEALENMHQYVVKADTEGSLVWYGGQCSEIPYTGYQMGFVDDLPDSFKFVLIKGRKP